jgi:hypothetical protein
MGSGGRPERYPVARSPLALPRGAKRPPDPGPAAGDAADDPDDAGNERTGGVRDDHCEAMAGDVMRASVGDVLVLPGSDGRTGEIIGVVGKDGTPPYVIKWHSDGHIAMVTPDPYSRIIRASDGSQP